MIERGRRWFLGGAIALVAAPAIVRVASIMPVRVPARAPAPTVYDRGPLSDIEWLREIRDRLYREFLYPPLLILSDGGYRSLVDESAALKKLVMVQDQLSRLEHRERIDRVSEAVR